MRIGAGGAPGQPGEASGVDDYFSANGGQVNFFESGGACEVGGSGGGNGGTCDGAGGDVQGPSFRTSLGNFNLSQITVGEGGASGPVTGGGGLVIGSVPNAQNGVGPSSAQGGVGMVPAAPEPYRQARGPGFIYVEW